MKLSRKQLRNLINETMIAPSNLYQHIIQDPKVNIKIKKLLQTGIDTNNQKTINTALTLLRSLGTNPEYNNAILNPHTERLTSHDYQKQFNDATIYGRTQTPEGAHTTINNILKPHQTNQPDITTSGQPSPGGYIIKIYTSNLQTLQLIKKDIKTSGLNAPRPIGDWYVHYALPQNQFYGKYELTVIFKWHTPNNT
jgi:hypothetical protein